MKTLTTTQELKSARHYYRGEKILKPALEVMDAATAELEANAAASRALKPGEVAPDFILPHVDGRSVRLYSELERGPVVLVFYRDGWCPYCNIHLRGFQKLLSEFEAADAQVIAISPQLPDQSLTTLSIIALRVVFRRAASILASIRRSSGRTKVVFTIWFSVWLYGCVLVQSSRTDGFGS